MNAVVLMLACAGEPAPASKPPDPPPSEARAQAAKGAPIQVAPWQGRWSVVVYGDPGSADAATFARGLGTVVTPWAHQRPRPPAGTAALVWVDAGVPVGELLTDLGQPSGPPGGEVDVIVGERDIAVAKAAAEQLPWSGVGVLTAVSALGWWVTPSAVEGRAVPLAAAREVADHYDLAYMPCSGTLGDVVVDAALCPTRDMLTSGDVRVRTESRRSLRAPGDAPDPELAVQLVQATFGEPPLVAALASMPSPDPLLRARIADRTDDVARLRAYAADPSSVVRVVAAHRLAHLAAGDGGFAGPELGALVALAASPDAYVRWKVAWGLGRAPGSTAVLLALLADVDVDVRREAAHSLGVLGDPSAVPALRAAQGDANSFVRRWVADALGHFTASDPGAAAGLESALADPAGMVRMAAAQGLRRPSPPWSPPHPEDLAEALRLLADPDPTTRKDACKFLAGVRDAAAQGALLRAAKDADSEVRKSAVEALGWDQGAVGAAALAAALEDPDPDVVVTALDALRRRGDLGSAGRALRQGTSPIARDGEVRLRLAEAMAASGVPAGDLDLADERAAAAFARRAPGVPGEGAFPWIVEVGRRQAALAPGSDALRWELGVLGREDVLVHLRFSWTDEADRIASHRALRDPVLREYGHPDRG